MEDLETASGVGDTDVDLAVDLAELTSNRVEEVTEFGLSVNARSRDGRV